MVSHTGERYLVMGKPSLLTQDSLRHASAEGGKVNVFHGTGTVGPRVARPNVAYLSPCGPCGGDGISVRPVARLPFAHPASDECRNKTSVQFLIGQGRK